MQQEDMVMNHTSRKEDAIIAFTWYHFLKHPNKPEYLLRLPMTKVLCAEGYFMDMYVCVCMYMYVHVILRD